MKKFLALLGCSTLLLVACSKQTAEQAMEEQIEQETGGEADVDVNADGDVRVETDEGSFAAGDDVSMPENWPTDVAVYAGAKVQFAGSATGEAGQPGSLVILSTQDTATDVHAYYKEQLVNDGWTIEAAMEQAGTFILSATKDNRVVSMSAGEAEGQTTVTLGIAMK